MLSDHVLFGLAPCAGTLLRKPKWLSSSRALVFGRAVLARTKDRPNLHGNRMHGRSFESPESWRTGIAHDGGHRNGTCAYRPLVINLSAKTRPGPPARRAKRLENATGIDSSSPGLFGLRRPGASSRVLRAANLLRIRNEHYRAARVVARRGRRFQRHSLPCHNGYSGLGTNTSSTS